MTDAAEQQLSPELETRLMELVRTPVLLVASDYDGTLSPIVANPEDAVPHREALVALRQLADLPQTHAAIISGRSLTDLADLTGEPQGVHLVGSHGSEFEPDFASSLTAEQRRLRDRIETAMKEIAARDEGLMVETKPASVAFHFRNAPSEVGQECAQAVMDGPGKYDGVVVKLGKMVVELGVVDTNKGKALEQIRHRLGVTAAVFLGDDITDEDAFRTLFGPDLGVKVGPGDSLARHRVAEPIDVGRVLARLAEERTKWLTGSQATPIERLSMLTDQRTVVLIDDHAKLVWGCMPRIDSSALFADLLGGPGAGAFEITPIHGEPPVLQDYRGDTFVLRTRWRDVTLTDYLDCSEGRTLQRAGRTDLVRVLEGTGRVRIEFAPRLDFGRTPTHLVVRDNGLAIDDTLDPVVLVSPGVQWHIDEDGKHQRAWADVELRGKPVVLELRYGTGSLNASVLPEAERRRQTEVHWSDWASKLTLPEMWPNLVKRGALALRGLVHGPTGAIAAAGTTSLPEHMGGVRNWDYRYCWPRDAAMAARTLTRLGSTGEALRFLDWLLGIVDEAGSAERLAPVYGVTGLDCSVEAEIAELAGYGGSRPVRIGNAAARQVQLDVFGPIVDLVATLMHRGAALSGEHWRVVEAMADAVAARWAEPDHGIWEIRGPRRHHVHSKVMCWVTLDRAAEISRSFLGRPREDFEALADTIKAEVIDRGWNEMLGGFGAAYDVEEWDAATLFIGLTGLIDPSDDRFKRTVEGTEQALRDGPTVYRYRGEDGLPGVEGGFHICAAWLAMSHAAIGQPQRAREIIDEIAALSGHTGLLSEQFDPAAKRALGNHPQAYSHLGLIDAILDVEALDK